MAGLLGWLLWNPPVEGRCGLTTAYRVGRLGGVAACTRCGRRFRVVRPRAVAAFSVALLSGAAIPYLASVVIVPWLV
jgi:hypothetical protein